MKKRVLSGVFALALLATAGFGVQKSMKSDVGLSDLALSNVEALASSESSDCPNGCYDNGTGCWCKIWYPCYREAN